ncbi:hypothetical protein [Plantactinospora endophytica]|uniref:Uncharacterized protein n=1 Tax=Plantactinospora endophytica TaxID=673535 RepID=A0ABQ4E221_9ACTN|nr:hypothetical protein [Plantactinospora endophytica]GIG88758.1 hypothetical protein Pen02_36940 [Plantactinospora endophytica]
MDPVVAAFGSALVAAMATDTWQWARTAVAELWRRRNSGAEAIDGELVTLRQRILDAREADRTDGERALAAVWQGRLQELLFDDPTLAAELQRILNETLLPMLAPADRARIGQITMSGESRDNSTFNQFVGDQHNTIRP